ncbi:hypothetical protein G7Z17_g11214 [Cylindrodendrum hubeiense]|uniref:Uncharacterized protein n=1 Tax=Cylindrodendrum hubeiense TaxID=595255 RepID=A0A9P5H4D7_9HYPO|nr:hypothetical protein G7Z17_g11214 [Cylindrodendrum hubeiense]
MTFPFTPTQPVSLFGDSTPQVHVSGLITPPDSPIEEFVPRYEKHTDSSAAAAYSPSIKIECGITHPISQVRTMATALEHARNNREFPSTTTSSMDTQAVIEDYERLMRLRQARGDLSLPAPEAYNLLRVEIARQIIDRDASIEESESNTEATRRVNSYLRSVEQERRYFDAANTILQRRGVSSPTQLDLDNVGEELCSIIEQTIEQSISDATGPLRLNVNSLHNETTDFKEQNDALGRQIDMHYHVLEQQTSTNTALLSMFEPQSKNIQATADQLVTTTKNLQATEVQLVATTKNLQATEEQLTLATGNTQTMDDQLTLATGNIQAMDRQLTLAANNVHATECQLSMAADFTNLLSQVVVNLPGAINQVVYTAVQQQTQDTYRNILEAQQKVILDLEMRSREIQSMAKEVEARRLQLASQGQGFGSTHISSSKSRGPGRKSKGKMRKMVNKVFSSQR